MSVTARGKRWETLHSLWIGWTFTLGFFNWVAFFYIGLRTKQRKWALWGLLYSVPFVVEMVVLDTETRDSTLGNLTIALQLLLAVISVIHAFRVRKEYLLRLEALQSAHETTDKEAILKRRIEAEYGARVYEETKTRDAVPVEPESLSGSSSGQGRLRMTPEETRASSPASASTPSPAAANGDMGSTPLLSTSGEELDYRIASSYPFPIAFGFRSLRSIVDVRDLYREQLRVAENMLAFLASVSLGLLKEEDREKSDIDPKDYWMTGVSPGDWKDIIARCSKVFTNYDDNPMALAIKGLNIRSEKKGFGADVAALIRAKNDFKHDRGPVVLEDLAEASRELQEKLKRCMEALAFFTAHPIRQVEDFNVSRRGESVVLKCLRYTGDHPSFPQEEVVFDRALPRGDLFLDLGQRGWAPLFPFITTMTCSHCKARETYFVDAWDTRKRMARMKSFERGHTMLNQEVSNALTEWVNESAQPGMS